MSDLAPTGKYEIKRPAANNIIFQNEKDGVSAELLTIKPDGAIVKGPNFTTDDQASLEFWDVLTRAFPAFLEAAIKARKP